MGDKQYIYEAELVRVIDGDTVRLRLFQQYSFEVDFGFHINETVETWKSTELNFRLYGIDTPEVRGVDAETKARGDAATVELERLLKLGRIQVKSYKPDKYGRWLVDIYVYPKNGEPLHVNEELIRSGHAERYLI